MGMFAKIGQFFDDAASDISTIIREPDQASEIGAKYEARVESLIESGEALFNKLRKNLADAITPKGP